MRTILLIYTGGTIGMIKDPQSGELRSFDFTYVYDHIPELARLNINLKSISFPKPIDSSEITQEHWKNLAQIIVENYEVYDGFVVLHGSDTMAFTSSALSFMLQGLKKPIIFTGSQLPIGTIRTDGKENLITAIEIAAAFDEKTSEAIVQEVAVYFEYSLYRGNRCSKISANQFEAFESPNYPSLAVAGVNIEYLKDRLFRTKKSALTVQSSFSNQIALIKLFPGIPFELYKDLFNINEKDRNQIGSSQNSIDIRNNQDLINQLIKINALTLAYETSANIDYSNTQELNQVIADLEFGFSQIGSIADRSIIDDLQALRYEAINYLNELALSVPNVVDYEVIASTPLTKILFNLYGNDDNKDIIISLNNINDTSSIAGTIKVLKYEE